MGAPGTPGAGRRTEVRGGGAGCWGGAAVPTQPTLHGIGGGGVGVGRGLLLFFPLSIPLVRNNVVREGPGGGHKGSLQRAASRGLRTGKLGKMYAAMIYIGGMRV